MTELAAAARHAWIDASAGIAGDMLLGALLDAGADLDVVRHRVAAVVADAVRIEVEQTDRAGLRASKAHVQLLVEDPPHRHWADVRTMITDADLPNRTRAWALQTFEVLAEAEGRVHGIPADDVHFHEVGALDSIADVVGVCAALDDLGVDSLSVGEVALGSGEINAAHGRMPVPVPAVLELSGGWRVRSGGRGELTTPTGMALIAALCDRSEDLPELRVHGAGVGAGTKNPPGRANVTRVVLGEPTTREATGRGVGAASGEAAVVLEANVDDLDPRLWPEVLSALLDAGADDAWLVPILMKKGRPAHTLRVLAPPSRADALRAEVLRSTSTFGIRQSEWRKYPVARRWIEVELYGQQIPIKIAVQDGMIVQATPEFEPVAALARKLGKPAADILAAANATAAAAKLRADAAEPD